MIHNGSGLDTNDLHKASIPVPGCIQYHNKAMKITKLKNGKYSTRVYLGIRNGKRISKRISGRSIAEVKKTATVLKNDFYNETIVEQDLSLGQAFDRFIEARSNILSPSTYRNYLEIRRSSFQDIMDKKICDITQEDIQSEVNAMAEKLSQKTIKNKLALFNSVYKTYAEKPKNMRLNIPPKQKKEVYIPSEKDIKTLLEYIRENEQYEDFLVPVLFGAYLGLRKGEILALTYDDIDFENKTVKITKSKVITSDNSFTVKQPKTYAGYRTLTIPEEIIKEIEKRRASHLPLTTSSMDRISHTFPRILRKAGLPAFRFHDLRHFFASMLLVLNIPDLYAIQLTGHSTTNMLKNVYQHTFADKEEEYKDLISKRLSP